MSSISEIKYKEIGKSKPYLTKAELGLLLNKQGRNLDKKVTNLLKKGELINLKKGLYVSHDYWQQYHERLPEYVANILYYPSYLSLEYVLTRAGLIPESVMIYTSVTLKVPRVFKNSLGTFQYRNLKPELFGGYQEVRFVDQYMIKMASTTKALFDWLYLKPFKDDPYQELGDLRINWQIFTNDHREEFEKYVRLSRSKKMEKLNQMLKKL